MSNKKLLFPILIFFFFNVLSTYFLTTSTFNIYIIPFSRHFSSEVVSVIGNIAILSIILIILFAIVKRAYKRMLWMGILSIILGFIIYILRVYTKYYLSFFSFRTLSVFRNPAASLGLSIAFESVKDFFFSFSFLLVIPGIGFIIYALHLKKECFDYSWNDPSFSIKIRLSGFLLAFITSYLCIFSFQKRAIKNWAYNSDLPLYGVQNAGVYNYYLYELFGADFRYDYTKFMNKEEVSVEIQKYNHQSENYESFIDGNNNDYGKGLFEGKNLYILQLESVNSFIIDLEINGVEVMPNLSRIIDTDPNLYYFENMYTNAGQGNTADAELSINAGVNPNGYSTLHWDYEDKNYDFTTLPELFKQKDSATKAYSFHGDTNLFYNRTKVHENLFGYDKYYALEDYLKTHKDDKKDPNSFINGWVKDEVMIDWSREILEDCEKYLAFNIMTVSHTPYTGNPLEDAFDWGINDAIMVRYLSYMRYVDNYLGKFFEDIKDDTDTIYILYGDHGAGLYGSSLKKIYGNISWLEQIQMMMKTPGIIYDASGSLNDFTGGDMKQELVRNHIDFYSTIITLFDLEKPSFVLGLNALTDEKTFAYNPNFFCIFTDAYMYSVKNNYVIYHSWYANDILKSEVKRIKKYKLLVEIGIQHNIFKN